MRNFKAGMFGILSAVTHRFGGFEKKVAGRIRRSIPLHMKCISRPKEQTQERQSDSDMLSDKSPFGPVQVKSQVFIRKTASQSLSGLKAGHKNEQEHFQIVDSF